MPMLDICRNHHNTSFLQTDGILSIFLIPSLSRSNAASKLQQQRKKCGYSQRELAEKSGVNLRTLQQYELKTKDIGKASVQTVIALAAVLGCPIEDLLEYAENDNEK